MIQDVQFQFQMSINSCYGTNASSISFTLVAPQGRRGWKGGGGGDGVSGGGGGGDGGWWWW